MVISRASAQWSSKLFRQSTRNIRSTNRTKSWQQAQKRAYASGGGHGSHQKSAFAGDLPWAITSIAVTIPSVYYLMQPQIERYSGKKGGHGGHEEHGHGDGEDDEHDGEQGEESESGEKSDSADGQDSADVDSGEGKEEGNEDANTEEAPKEGEEESSSDGSDSEGANKSGPDTPSDKGHDDVAHETQSGENIEGVQFKGATSGGTRDGEQGDTRKHIPDAKGGSKKRIESDYGMRQGEATEPEQDPSGDDMAATAKSPAGMNKQSGKQEGISNTDTKHSTDIANDPDKSTKPTGSPETAKEKGTVDPRRPQS